MAAITNGYSMLLDRKMLTYHWEKKFLTDEIIKEVEEKFYKVFETTFKTLSKMEEGEWGDTPIFWEAVNLSDEYIADDLKKDFLKRTEEIKYSPLIQRDFVGNTIYQMICEFEEEEEISECVECVTAHIVNELKTKMYDDGIINLDGDLI